jgi:hypothetical protein
MVHVDHETLVVEFIGDMIVDVLVKIHQLDTIELNIVFLECDEPDMAIELDIRN